MNRSDLVQAWKKQFRHRGRYARLTIIHDPGANGGHGSYVNVWVDLDNPDRPPVKVARDRHGRLIHADIQDADRDQLSYMMDYADERAYMMTCDPQAQDAWTAWETPAPELSGTDSSAGTVQ